MAGLCEGGNEPPGSLKPVSNMCQGSGYARTVDPETTTFQDLLQCNEELYHGIPNQDSAEDGQGVTRQGRLFWYASVSQNDIEHFYTCKMKQQHHSARTREVDSDSLAPSSRAVRRVIDVCGDRVTWSGVEQRPSE
ncbi:hypothetical protein ANN_04310 [Periplaneta americana]|uniref:Uncharacterized protein n=1 Tax=Periplaneta americana TaxID=6978 RepID=A0ABQ8T874_PERAM|nr:hypothetical protein ANN_04310 [Periplaneta americana]